MREVITDLYDGRRTLIQHFYEDFHEFIQHTTDLDRTWKKGGYRKVDRDESTLRSRMKAPHSWDLGFSWEEVKEMALCDGWPKGLEIVREMSGTMSAEFEQYIPESTPSMDVSGSFIDIGAYVSGNPECFYEFSDDDHMRSNVITMLVDFSETFKQEAITVMRKGAAIVALIDLLESLQYRVEVVSVDSTNTHDCRAQLEYILPLKSATQPLHRGVLALTCCNAGMRRRIHSSWLEQFPKSVRRRSNVPNHKFYGYVCPPSMHGYSGDIVVGGYGGDGFVSDAAAKDWIKKALKRQGFDLDNLAPEACHA